jgi:hypothetical protein
MGERQRQSLSGYTAAEAQAKRSSGTLAVQPVALRKRLDDAGLLPPVEVEQRDGREVRHLTPRACPGRKERALHLTVSTLRSEPPPGDLPQAREGGRRGNK